MSRTKNISKHDFQLADYDYEFPNGYVAPLMELKPGDEYHVDPSGTTGNDYRDPWLDCTRHPNKRKKRGSLNRDFKNVGMSSPSYWKNRFGDAYDKSSRMRLIKREMTQTRRHRMKHDTEEEIERSLNEQSI